MEFFHCGDCAWLLLVLLFWTKFCGKPDSAFGNLAAMEDDEVKCSEYAFPLLVAVKQLRDAATAANRFFC